MNAESVSCTDEAVVDRPFAMSMNVGRYMSVPSGPAADSSASDVRTAAVSWFFFGTVGECVSVDFGSAEFASAGFASAEWMSTRSTLPTDDERPRSGDYEGEGFEDDEFGSVLTRCTYRVTFLSDNNAFHRITCWLRACDVSMNGPRIGLGGGQVHSKFTQCWCERHFSVDIMSLWSRIIDAVIIDSYLRHWPTECLPHVLKGTSGCPSLNCSPPAHNRFAPSRNRYENAQ